MPMHHHGVHEQRAAWRQLWPMHRVLQTCKDTHHRHRMCLLCREHGSPMKRLQRDSTALRSFTPCQTTSRVGASPAAQPLVLHLSLEHHPSLMCMQATHRTHAQRALLQACMGAHSRLQPLPSHAPAVPCTIPCTPAMTGPPRHMHMTPLHHHPPRSPSHPSQKPPISQAHPPTPPTSNTLQPPSEPPPQPLGPPSPRS